MTILIKELDKVSESEKMVEAYLNLSKIQNFPKLRRNSKCR